MRYLGIKFQFSLKGKFTLRERHCAVLRGFERYQIVGVVNRP